MKKLNYIRAHWLDRLEDIGVPHYLALWIHGIFLLVIMSVASQEIRPGWGLWSFSFFLITFLLIVESLSIINWIGMVFIARWEEKGKKVVYMPSTSHTLYGTRLSYGTAMLLPCFVFSTKVPQGYGVMLLYPAFVVGLAVVDLLLRTHRVGFGARVISIPNREYFIKAHGEHSTQTHQVEEQEAVVEPTRARFNFDAVDGMLPLKRKLVEAGHPVVRGKADPSHCRNGILLNGDPGNGKTFIAEALAGELNVGFVSLDYGMVNSKWVGDTPARITRAFEQAKQAAPCVLFIDEIDSFIPSRDGSKNQLAESDKIVNVMLTELVNIRRHRVLVVAATNRQDKLDAAAIREGRFDFKIEVSAPDEAARIGLLTKGLQKRVGIPLDMEAVHAAAKRWNGFNVKRILAVTEEMPTFLRTHRATMVGYEELMGALRQVQGRKGRVPADTKSLNELVLPEATKTAISMVAKRLMDTLRIERLGGSLPSGVLFHGPSGTGKTAVARALAKETAWAFLTAAGPDLLRDPDAFEKLYAEAKELRPAIVFIDEADDILRDRSYSQASAITNKILTVMDGAGDKVRDVVVIAATNNPEQIDPAMLRAGRFTEKVPFFVADAASVRVLVLDWLSHRKVQMASGATPDVIAKLLDGLSPANVEGVLQYALNTAIHLAKDDDVVVLSLDHVATGLAIVAPQ